MDATFLNEEVRDGYLVKTETKKLWAVELDILSTVKNLCDKHGIRYFAIGGTLLGAVRHKGFIPWDDDIDIGMLYDDYQRFLKIASDELKYPYFLQSYLTEKEASPLISRVRRTDTTGCTAWEYDNARYDFNMGIFIDIFPLFYVPDNSFFAWYQEKRLMLMSWALHGHDLLRSKKIVGLNIKKKDIPYCLLWQVVSIFSDYKSYEKKYIEVCNIEKKKTGNIGLTSYYRKEVYRWPTSVFCECVELPFENTFISCPADYEGYLDKQYGNWRTPVKVAAQHSMKVIDTEIPYKEKLKTHIEGDRV